MNRYLQLRWRRAVSPRPRGAGAARWRARGPASSPRSWTTCCYRAIRHFLDRRQDLPAQARERLAERLAQPLRQRLERISEAAPLGPEAFLEDVAREFEQHRRS